MHSDIGVSNVFLDMSPQARKAKTKQTNDYINPEIFCTAKETIIKMKRQFIDWEKTLYILYLYPDSISDKGVRSKIYKEHITQQQKHK